MVLRCVVTDTLATMPSRLSVDIADLFDFT